MKILLVSVLFVSVTFANRVDLQYLTDQGSRETSNIERSDESVEVEPISENFLTEELEVQPLKRSKKYLTQPPPQCTYSGCNGNQYDQRPTMEYNNPQYPAIPAAPAANLYNSPQKHQYHAAAPVYSQPTYNTPNHNAHNYNTPSYKAPSYSAPSYNVPSYNVPSYNVPSYNVPSYNVPSYNVPSYSEPSYNVPSYSAASYNVPTYNTPNYNSPNYNVQNYNAPSYQPPAPAYPSSSNFYPQSHEPYHSPLPTNLLIGCHPHVSMVHDTGYTSPFYNSPHYNQPPPHHNPASYRHHSPDDSAVSTTKGYDFSSREMMPERETQMDNSQTNTKTAPAKDNSAKSAAKNEKNDTIQSANTFEEAKIQQHDTLFKMAQYQNQLSQGKNMVSTEEKPKKESAAAPGKKIK